jgi:hypothetical protein
VEITETDVLDFANSDSGHHDGGADHVGGTFSPLGPLGTCHLPSLKCHDQKYHGCRAEQTCSPPLAPYGVHDRSKRKED